MTPGIVCGDCKEIMAGLPDDSIDLIVTDPPYGWSFMGKDWDKAVPSVDIWRECLRVLKPGAFAFMMSGPRMDCLSEMGKRLAEAGFETGFTPIFWAYASGFPKAQNIGKAVDKRAGRIGKSVVALKHELRKRFDASGKTRNQIDKECGFRAANYLTLPGDGKRPDPWINVLPPQDKWQTMKHVLGCGDELDELFDEAEREVISKGKCGKTAFMGGLRGIQTTDGEYDFTAPATPQAQALDGSYAGFQPKPAVEVVIVAMKPLAHGTYVDQALDNGKGVTWLDKGRIPYQNNDKPKGGYGGMEVGMGQVGEHQEYESCLEANPSGRFPANLLVEDDCLDDGIDRPSGGGNKAAQVKNQFFGLPNNVQTHGAGGDSGSFSRYFSLDSWWDDYFADSDTAEELNTGWATFLELHPDIDSGWLHDMMEWTIRGVIDEVLRSGLLSSLPESVQRTFPFLIVPKAGKKEKNLGCKELLDGDRCVTDYGKGRVRVCNVCGCRTNDLGRGGTWPGCEHHDWDWREQAGTSKSAIHNPNHHPTVKPLKLMSYLITLGSRPGDLVLDPFAGTCTTGMAAKMLGRDWLMVEIDEEWCRIGERRIGAVAEQLL